MLASSEELKIYAVRGLAALAVLSPILFLLKNLNFVIISAVGSTAFVVFGMPEAKTARPRNVLGGHLVGILSGYLAIWIPQTSLLLTVLGYSLAISLCIFLMLLTETEHPPAAGTALGITLEGFNPTAAGGIITAAAILSLVVKLIKRSEKF